MSLRGLTLKLGLPLALIAAAVLWVPADPPLRLVGIVAAIGVVWVAGLLLARARARTRLRREQAMRASKPQRTASDEAVLKSLGIDVDNGEVKAACARVARRLHNERIRVIGFVPSEDRVAVPPILIQLGIALTELTGATIAVVDANVRYPGLRALNAGKPTDSDQSVFSTHWLRGSLALLSAPEVERAGQVVPQLARVLIDGQDLFAHVLVDLTGFELLGEHASAAACMDAVALVGRAHHSRERELLELARLMPHSRFLGVLLVG
ncbi:MAG TPA: hypothetical protein VFT22_40450 [Kofleriaceae bacterium]|nr:hypothetical protein [Kofleriaceae bacterium]